MGLVVVVAAGLGVYRIRLLSNAMSILSSAAGISAVREVMDRQDYQRNQ